MALTDQLKIIDNKIKANQAWYDLDGSAAKISAYSSGDLREYEYLIGEDLGYKASVVEQAKFDYSPLGNSFVKGLTEEDKKEGLLKRAKNIEDKNEELLKIFSASTNAVSEAAKNKIDYNYDKIFAFYRLHRDFKKFKIMSLGSKYDEINDFLTLLNEFIKTHKATTTETKYRKKK